jgi:hypothetical protein
LSDFPGPLELLLELLLFLAPPAQDLDRLLDLFAIHADEFLEFFDLLLLLFETLQDALDLLDQILHLDGVQLDLAVFLLELPGACFELFVQLRLVLLADPLGELRLDLDNLLAVLDDSLEYRGIFLDLFLTRVMRVQSPTLDLYHIIETEHVRLELLHILLELLGRGIEAEDRFGDPEVPPFDPFGDLYLPFTIEERNLAHFSKIHANRVVVADRGPHLVDRFTGLLLLPPPARLDLQTRLLLRVEVLYLLLAETVVELDDIIRFELFTDEILDLLVENVPLVIGQLLDVYKNLFNLVEIHQYAFPP